MNFFGILTLIFITLKLVEIITWSWLWVLSPIWMPVSLILIFSIFFTFSFLGRISNDK